METPEAVYDGLRTACNVLTWLPHSHRLVVLVGDAPPHGDGGDGDCFPAGCPCGLDADAVTALLETEAISLYALPMHAAVETAFERLARFTGGESYPVRGGDAAIESFKGLLTREFADLDFDRQVLIAIRRMPECTVDDLCRAVDGARGRVSASLSRLGRRRLLSQA